MRSELCTPALECHKLFDNPLMQTYFGKMHTLNLYLTIEGLTSCSQRVPLFKSTNNGNKEILIKNKFKSNKGIKWELKFHKLFLLFIIKTRKTFEQLLSDKTVIKFVKQKCYCSINSL